MVKKSLDLTKPRHSELILPIPWPFVILYNFANCHSENASCLHGGGGPQVGEVKYGGSPHLSCKRDQIKMRDYMDKRVTPPKRVTSPSWGPLPLCKQTLSLQEDYYTDGEERKNQILI